MEFLGKKIVLGICGSIAAYKSPLLVREIIRRGGSVRIVMTPSAAKFVAPLTLQNLTNAPVIIDMFDANAQSGGSWHIHLARECDAMVIAPASAASLARLAIGLADTAIITTAMSLPPGTPLLVAPAMDSEMWLHPSVQRNAELIRSYGAIIIPPAEGALASGQFGVGRLPEIETIVNELHKALQKPKIMAETAAPPISEETIRRRADLSSNPLQESVEKTQWSVEFALNELKKTRDAPPELKNHINTSFVKEALKDKKILITAGPTYEKIDDVRFVGNFSSGKMGFAIAEAAVAVGAIPTVIAGPVNLPTPAGVRRIDAISADEMYAAAVAQFADADCAILTAAVADFKPATPRKGKIKKESLGEEFLLKLIRSPDILSALGACKTERQVVVGFALEAEDEVENGRKKLIAKKADLIVVNSSSIPGSGFQSDNNTITIISKTGEERSLPMMSKRQCADEILESVAKLFL